MFKIENGNITEMNASSVQLLKPFEFEQDTTPEQSIYVSEYLNPYRFREYKLNNNGMTNIKEELKHYVSNNELTIVGPIRVRNNSENPKKFRNPYSYLSKKNDDTEVTAHKYIAKLQRSIDEQRKQLDESVESIARLQRCMNLILEKTGFSKTVPKSLDPISQTIGRPVRLNETPVSLVQQFYKNETTAALPTLEFIANVTNLPIIEIRKSANGATSLPNSEFYNYNNDRNSAIYQQNYTAGYFNVQQMPIGGVVKQEPSRGNHNTDDNPGTYNLAQYFRSFTSNSTSDALERVYNNAIEQEPVQPLQFQNRMPPITNTAVKQDVTNETNQFNNSANPKPDEADFTFNLDLLDDYHDHDKYYGSGNY